MINGTKFIGHLGLSQIEQSAKALIKGCKICAFDFVL